MKISKSQDSIFKSLKNHKMSDIIKVLQIFSNKRGEDFKLGCNYLYELSLVEEAIKVLKDHPITNKLRKLKLKLRHVSLDDGEYVVGFYDEDYTDSYYAKDKDLKEALFIAVSRMPTEIKNKLKVKVS